VDLFEGIAVATNFLFVPVSQMGLTKHDGGDTSLLSHDTLNPIRRHRAFNQGMI
jgi:hypothetical protein